MTDVPIPPVALKPRRRTERPVELSQALFEIVRLVESTDPLDAVLHRITRITADLMQMPICSIYLLDPDGMLRKRSNVGLDQALEQQATFRLGEGIPGWVAKRGKRLALADVTKDPRYGPRPVALKEPHAYICAPLRVGDRIIGVMTAREMRVRHFTRTDVRFFQTAAQMSAIVIDKHRLHEDLIRAQRLEAVGRSLSEIAHYAKNVMFTAQVAEKMVNKHMEQDHCAEPVRGAWRNLRRANMRIRKLVEDMLYFTRERPLQLEEADIGTLVAEAVHDLHDHAERHGVEMVTSHDPAIGRVWVDGSAIYDVLLNLVTNGIDAIPEGRGGKVTVRTRRAGDERYAIEVEDNGAGIPEEIRPKIFQLFFSTKGERGTGIGLAATRKTVEKHGGTIDFTSAEGQGTCVRVELPIAPPAPPPAFIPTGPAE